MKIIHSSDWHIGRALHGRKRYDEFESYLNWLLETIKQNEINAILVAGDIFDSSVPGNRAQELYYRFLSEVSSSSCRHVVIIAGNHDSPSFLNAPRKLLRFLNVHVVGNSSEELNDEVLVLCDQDDKPELIVCAVPYLRDRDIRSSEAGESLEDKEKKLLDGIREHYAAVGALAEQKRTELGLDIPIVGMGHLFTAGGRTIEGDGVRELYIGSLALVKASSFPACFDYTALGHLHVPQRVNGSETIRYSGSPLAIGFGEANQKKSICQVDFENGVVTVKLIEVPVWQKLESIKGNWNEIENRIGELVAIDSSAWLEIIYQGDEIISDLQERVVASVEDSKLEILRIKNTRLIDRVLEQSGIEETLDDLDENEVFERCLASHEVPQDQRRELLSTYQELLVSYCEKDRQKE